MKMKRHTWAVLIVLFLTTGWTETEIFQAKLESLDVDSERVVLKRKGGADVQANLYKKARFWLKKKPVTQQEFEKATGEQIMVRMSVKTSVTPTVREMADLDTWKWLDTIRRGVVKGRILELEENALVIEFPDKSQFVYKLTAKTKWERDSQPAKLEDFRVGEAVFIAPRLLSNLDTMLNVVSNTEKGSQVGRERLLPTFSGTLESVDLTKKVVKVRTKAGDVREMRYDDKTEFVLNSKPVKPDKIKIPTEVTVHRGTDAQGNDYTRRITVKPKS
jgi:hypothetical protein